MPDTNHQPQAQEQLRQVFSQQRQCFQKAPYPELAQRKENLRRLRDKLLQWQDQLCDTVSEDFEGRAHAETKMLELLSSRLEIDHTLAHLKRWLKPSRRHTELLFLSNSLKVTYQPKGVVGIIVPWNFPVYLAIGPLAAALGAGNRVILKLSEATPKTNAALKQMLAEIFSSDEVAVFGEELTDPAQFTQLPFDHLIFTGSTRVGRLVMAAAAQHLTPVTLELGGKSPALVAADYPIADAALRIVHGKGTNCGQACVAPDYALVPAAKESEFVEAAKLAFQRLYGSDTLDPDSYTTIIDQRHQQRLVGLLTDAREKGATVIPCQPYTAEQHGRRMPLHIVYGVTPDMGLMQEEIFGPILPVVSYQSFPEALAFIQQRPRPLALYLFSREGQTRDEVLEKTHSGGVTVNDWGWHVLNHDVPFGGIGESGMGSYHGEEGFRSLSHARPVFSRHRFFPTSLFHPPYGNIVQRLTLLLWLGRQRRR